MDHYAGTNVCASLFEALERRLAQGPPYSELQ